MGGENSLFSDDESNLFLQRFGWGSGPDTFVASMLDPKTFVEKFGPPSASTATFRFQHPEWVFCTADKKETLKAAIINGVVVIAFVSEETFGKFLAFVDRKQATPAGG